jgi:hypothetical protein
VTKRREESLIEEMRAAMAHDRESVRRGSPVAQGFAIEEPAPVTEPEPEPPRRRGLARLLRRDS